MGGTHEQWRHVRIHTDRNVDARRVDPATGLAARERLHARIANLSTGGALLLVDLPVWLGAHLELRASWSDPTLKATLRARVLRVAAVNGGFKASVEFQHPTGIAPLELVRWVLLEAKRTDQLSGRIVA